MMLAASVALLGALAAGTVGIRMDYGQGDSGARTPAAATAAEISRALPAGVSDPTSVFVAAEDAGTLTADRLGGLSRALAEVEGVGQVAPTVLNEDHRAARIDVYPTADPQSQEARDLASGPIRAAVAAHAPAGTAAHVGGTAAVFADISAAVYHDLTIVFPVAAVLIALILLLLLRSLLAPMALLLSVGLGFAATLGAATLLFQHTLGRPGVSFTLPLVLFLFVVALGTDYNILITDRIREEMRRPGPARAAVARALRHTAPAIATAGLILAGSFATLATTPGTEQVAFAMTLGILLSALVLSLVLVPALAALLGRTLWWPVRPRPTPGTHLRPRTTEPAGIRNPPGSRRTSRFPGRPGRSAVSVGYRGLPVRCRRIVAALSPPCRRGPAPFRGTAGRSQPGGPDPEEPPCTPRSRSSVQDSADSCWPASCTCTKSRPRSTRPIPPRRRARRAGCSTSTTTTGSSPSARPA